MTDETIPEDIREKAWQLADGHLNSVAQAEAIAAALFSERTRQREIDARIAEEWPLVEKLLPLADESHNAAAATGQHEAAERIAYAIRQP